MISVTLLPLKAGVLNLPTIGLVWDKGINASVSLLEMVSSYQNGKINPDTIFIQPSPLIA
jgi:hypothetical protein